MKRILPLLSCTITILLCGCFSSEDEKAATTSSNTEQASESTLELADRFLNKAGDQLGIELNTEKITQGIQETLKFASTAAIEELVQGSGIELPLPDSLEQIKQPIEKLGNSGIFDQLKSSMGTAATSALGESGNILNNVISNLQISNPQEFLKSNASATDFLKSQSFQTIVQQLLPIVKKATANSGTSDLINKIKEMVPEGTGSLLGGLASIAGLQFPEDLDLDQYLTNATVNKLFSLMSAKEEEIKNNPEAAGSNLLNLLYGQ